MAIIVDVEILFSHTNPNILYVFECFQSLLLLHFLLYVLLFLAQYVTIIIIVHDDRLNKLGYDRDLFIFFFVLI